MASTLASTPMTPQMEIDKEWMTSMHRRQAELLHHQLMDQYINLMKVDGPLIFNPRSERDWDTFFSKLEERFLIVGVLPEYKIHLTRRFLRDEYLRKWIELSQVPGTTYESVRDGLYHSFFPNSDLWDNVMRVILGPWVEIPPQQQQGQIQQNKEEPQQQTSQSGEEARSSVDETQQQGVPRRVLNSASAIRNRVNVERQNLHRVAERYGKDTPEEDVWIKWACSMMTPPLQEAVRSVDSAPTVIAILDKLVESENSAANTRFRNRKNRPRGFKRSQRAGGNNSSNQNTNQSTSSSKPAHQQKQEVNAQ